MSGFCTQCGKALQDGETCACQQAKQVTIPEEPKTDYAPADFIPEPIQPVPDEPIPVQPPVQPMMGGGTGQSGPNNFNQAPMLSAFSKPSQELPSKIVGAFAIVSLAVGGFGLFAGQGLLAGILAIVFAVMARKNYQKEGTQGWEIAQAGFILGVINIALWLIGLIFGAAALGAFAYGVGNMFD